MKFNLNKYNTLRNQIIVVFLFVMLIVLLFVGITVFNLVSNLLKNNAEKQINETAIEANGRIESLYQQINMLSKQVATNQDIQQQLLNHKNGKIINYHQRQTLMQIANSFQAYSNGISSFELYTYDNQRLFPLDEENLFNRIEHEWIEQADHAKGQLVWIGEDPKEPSFFLAIRRISLIDQSFSNGGYLLIQINPSYLKFVESNQENKYLNLTDAMQKPIVSNYDGNMFPTYVENENNFFVNETEYMVIREKSELTGWTLTIYTPVDTLMEGISVVKTTIIISGAVGVVIFIIFSYFLSTVITRPIFNLTQTMLKANEGELKKNPEMFSTIEISQLNRTYNQLVDETNHLIQQVYEKELMRSRAELKALQAQINPHFLFNTLDALYWSLEEKGEEELGEMVVAMSELFRYTIGSQETNEWVTLGQALDHVEKYMQIMKIRFGERFTYKIDYPSFYENIKLPKLLIQPLVENAISHGIGNKIGQGSVSVIVEPSIEANHLIIKVIDDGIGMDEETINRINSQIESGKVSSLKGNGIAIANVNKRLKLYYQDKTYRGIEIRSEKNKGTSFTFEIPVDGGVLS